MLLASQPIRAQTMGATPKATAATVTTSAVANTQATHQP